MRSKMRGRMHSRMHSRWRKLAGSAGVLAVVAGGLFAASLQGHAARGKAAVVNGAASQEIVVFEVDDCSICGLFRDHVLPNYRRSARASELPIRFIDVNAEGVDKMKLIAPIQVVPTVVVIKDGQEVDRISGYTGPENFFELVSRMLEPAD
jgi:thiol-disulfide isomerase/thioredoxin